MTPPPRVLIIAGSDSGGGAGIQADIKTVTMLGGHAMTAITAITAQNTLGVQAVMPVPAEMVLAQIDSVVSDIGVDAVKIGMIGSAEVAHAVADRLENLAVPIVFDPVMVATSGSLLADEATIAVFARLAGIATVTTPNRQELEVLTGRTADTEEDQFEAIRAFMEATGCRALLAKGGHSHNAVAGSPRDERLHMWVPTEERLIDHLYTVDPDGRWLKGAWEHKRIDTRHSHGTGCTLASAIATDLGRGVALNDAVPHAIDFVLSAMRAAPLFGAGNGPMGHALGHIPFDDIHRKE